MIEFNPASPQHLSLLFFGGTIQDEIIEWGLYKNGNPKKIKTKILKKIDGLGLNPLEVWQTKKQGIYSVDEKTLQLLSKGGGAGKEIADVMLEIRGMQKELGTYYNSVEELIYPDSCLHPQFQHVSTDTSRLSCTNPNIQNSPASVNTKVPEHFTSRFLDGKLLAADYKGLEVRCEAQLSGDNKYIQDIINNVDPHTKNLSLQYKISYEDAVKRVESGELEEARKKVKGFTFSVQYGAGDRKIAENSGLSIKDVKDLREERKKTYPRLHMYYEWLKTEVNRNGYYTDPWGRYYIFRKYPKKFDWQTGDSYSPTEIMNYRTQGFATGTVVISMVGIFWRKKALHKRDKYVMINEVHDSLMLDCKKEYLEEAKEDLKILENVNEVSKQYFNYEWKVPIEIDIKHGESWNDL